MNLYKLTQNENTGYDTFSCIIVCAESETKARLIHPYGESDAWKEDELWKDSAWASSPQNVNVTLIGKAVKDLKAGIICRSFHAG